MPENEFEKNIQGRLDLLSLEPSPAVWQGVELRIRKDKRKRRWFIWLPLAAALGTGMWLWLGNGSDAVNRINESAKYPSQSSASANKEANNRETEKIEKDVQQESAGAEKNASSKKPQFVDQNNVAGTGDLQHKIAKGNYPPDKKSAQRPGVTATKDAGADTELQKAATTEGDKKESVADGNGTTVESVATPDTSSIAKLNAAKNATKTENSAAQATTQKLHQPKKWHWGIVAGVGISTQSNSIFSASHARANDLYSAQSYQGAPPPPTVQNTSTIKSGLAFSFGGFVERRINKSISVEIGIDYAQYGTQVTVGQKVDSTIAIFVTPSSFLSTNSYYRANGSEEKTHQNIYRFLELPVKANIRLNPRGKTPFRWELGLAPSLLLSTNALNYDPAQNIYYRRDDFYNKFQLGLNTGLSIMLFSKSKTPVWVGPEYRGFLMNLTNQNNSKGNHLNYGGVKLAFPIGAW